TVSARRGSEEYESDGDEDRLRDAAESVRLYLEEFGASTDDAVRISSSCPNYLDMLMDSVDDIDHWNSLSASDSDRESMQEAVDFRKKVYQMAKQKGDNGLLPFLESIGVSLPSATHLARYLSSSVSNSLPLLIHKVNHLKGVLYSGGGADDLQIIAKNARRMMAHLSISADEDVQQTLAFFQKIQARRDGLNRLGNESASFHHLIESFPRLLLFPVESRMKPMVEFLGGIGIPDGGIRNVVLLFPPILWYDIEKDIKPRLKSFEKVGAKGDDLGKMLVKYPWMICASVQDNFHSILAFLDHKKVPKNCSSRAITKWPLILGSSITRLSSMVEELNSMGIERQKLGQIISRSPQLLLRKPEEIRRMKSFFRDLGMDDGTVAKTFVRCPEVLAANREATLERKLEFLFREVGISESEVRRVICKYPEALVCDVERAMQPRMSYLREVGFSKRDVASMVRRFSPLLGYSVEKVMKPKVEFLAKTMRRPLRDVVGYPRYLSYSLERKIKPRYYFLRARNMELSLKEMLGKNDEQFAVDY
ncbi:hypothetical protein M569_13638, partial [Genlisea aurea]